MLSGLDDYLREIDSMAAIEPARVALAEEMAFQTGELALLPRPDAVVGAAERTVLQSLATNEALEHLRLFRLPAEACSISSRPSTLRISWNDADGDERCADVPIRQNPAYTPEQLAERAALEEQERREARARAAAERRRARKQARLEAAEREIPAAVREAWRRETYAHRSTPAVHYLAHMGAHATKRFVQRARFEQSLSEDDDFRDLLIGQTHDWDAILRDWFLADAPTLATPVLAALKHPAQHEIVEAYLSGHAPTLGLTHIWLIGLRRALGARDPLVTAWSRSRFLPQTSRHAGENEDTYVALKRKADNLAHTVDIVREHYRNPLAHGAANAPSTAADNRAFCELVYGTPSLAHWLEVGTNPDVHRSPHFGWFSFLTFARAEPAT